MKQGLTNPIICTKTIPYAKPKLPEHKSIYP